jgi:segregation and condensation protein B
MSKENLEKIKLKVEAVLFSYGMPISVNELMSVIGVDSELLIKNSIKELEDKYEKGYSFTIKDDEDGKWRMVLKEEYEDLTLDLISKVEIPTPALKVLSIVAYEQPVSRTRLAEILGKSAKQELEYLYKNKFVNYEKRGIGRFYKVTKKFYDYFKIEEDEDFRNTANQNIKEFLEELPSEKLIEDVSEEKKDIVSKQ